MKNKLIMFGFIAVLILFGCNSVQDYSESSGAVSDSAGSGWDSNIGSDMDDEAREEAGIAPDSEQLDEARRRIIYNAYLDLEVRQYLDVTQNIEKTVTDMNGYIVSNQTSRFDNDLHHGNIQLRIPQESLDRFFNYLEDHEQISINQRDLVGEDVTDQYVDLATRLDSREQLEDRLLTFMEEAETTEDLLNISRDLANVQYEIERIKGQMNYIDNRADFATVELSIVERQTEFAHEQGLDVWERTKEQWLNSYNTLLIGATNLFVFVVGNLPIIIVMFVLGGIAFWLIKKRQTKQPNE